MKKRWIKRITYTLILLAGIAGCVFIWADRELNKVLGESTGVIDINSIVKSAKTIHIKNVNILSEDCTYFIGNQDIIIENGSIIEIGENLPKTIGCTLISGTGKYLIPGLIDSHVHLKKSKNDLYLYLANGITYVREMAGNLSILEWRNDSIRPRMFIASPPIFSKKGVAGYYYSWTRQSVNYSTDQDAQKALMKIKKQGYDAIKMYGFVNSDMFRTTLSIAEENNMPVIGHIPLVDLETFYPSGQKEVAHIEELTVKSIDDFGKSVSKNPKEYLAYLEKYADQIAKKLKENEISVTSTMWLCESFKDQRFDLQSKLRLIELRYANPKIIEGTPLYKMGWVPGKNGYEYNGENSRAAKERSRVFWKTYAEAIHIMAKALVNNNVTIMAGTDANVATVVPGFSLHDELQSLSASGLSNSRVLYAATVAPSGWMKSKTGKVKVGYKSDLILLSKNPLEDIKNTKTIEYVFFDKYLIDKRQIRTILNAIETANNENRSIKINKYKKITK